LRVADFSSADLSEADLSQSKLSQATLKGANLKGAILDCADLLQADLNAAILCDARLVWTKINRASLIDTDFTGAVLGATTFGDLDLGTARGLDTLRHVGASTVGIDTIFKSKGKIPEVFLRGCGLTDWEIEAAKLYDPSLSAFETTDIAYQLVHLRNSQPFQYYSCFISYSTHDQEFAERLHATCRPRACAAGLRLTTLKAG
jgi:uncharacterized protein YjbI with pentapeptide repeats